MNAPSLETQAKHVEIASSGYSDIVLLQSSAMGDRYIVTQFGLAGAGDVVNSFEDRVTGEVIVAARGTDDDLGKAFVEMNT